MNEHERYMNMALEQARLAAELSEVPVGAVVILGQQIVGRGYNRRETDQDPLAHAEILALRQAAKTVGSWRLGGATVYVTLEPCVMCAGALVNAGVDQLVYGCDDPKAGAVRSLFALCEDPRLNHRIQVTRGVLSEVCSEQLRAFFADLRNSPKTGD
jgi:tRNA(adenine34) deaminase